MRSVISKFPFYLFAALAFLVGFGGAAFAAGATVPDDGSWIDIARPAFDLFLSGNYFAGSAAALVLAVALVRRYAPGRLGELVHTDVGGALLTLLGSFGAALTVTLAGGAALTLAGAWMALGVAVTAAGGYTLINKLIAPLEALAPAWAKPLFRLLTWILDQPSTVIADAEKAGDEAVEARPAGGAASALGEATELK